MYAYFLEHNSKGNKRTYHFLEPIIISNTMQKRHLSDSEAQITLKRLVFETPGTKIQGKLVTILLLHQFHTQFQDLRVLGLDICQTWNASNIENEPRNFFKNCLCES